MKFLLVAGALFGIATLGGCSDGASDPSDDDDGASSAEQALSGSGSSETAAEAAARRAEYPIPNATQRADALAHHSDVDPAGVVPRDLLGGALAFFDLNQAHVRNARYVSVIDFGKHSAKRRFFIVDMQTGAVESHVVAHGSGSDPFYTGTASRFSNTNGSNASSLGYYLTAETYYGNHGNSLRLDGLSDTNSNVRARDVVVHGASYVDDGRSKQGRSWGCAAVSLDEAQGIIGKLKGGSVLFAERAGHLDD